MSVDDVVYVRSLDGLESEEDEEDGDIWDDSKLNDAYDKALQMANVEVAKRIAMSTNSNGKKEEAAKPKPEKSASKASGAKKSQKKDGKTKWENGMPCRAVYHGDGLEYEGLLLSMINEQECVVKFLGYNNSEVVPIDSIMPSKGQEERRIQIAHAIMEKGDAYETNSLEDYFSDTTPMPPTMPVPMPGKLETPLSKISTKNKKNMKSNISDCKLPDIPMPNISMLREMGKMEMPLPPPPPLGFPAETEDTEEQALSSMLLSWYMSGYYTGLYQGMKRGRSNAK